MCGVECYSFSDEFRNAKNVLALNNQSQQSIRQKKKIPRDTRETFLIKKNVEILIIKY